MTVLNLDLDPPDELDSDPPDELDSDPPDELDSDPPDGNWTSEEEFLCFWLWNAFLENVRGGDAEGTNDVEAEVDTTWNESWSYSTSGLYVKS